MDNLRIYDITKNIIEKSEANILKYKSDNKFIFYFNKHILFPIMYVKLGSNDFLKPVLKWMFLSFILLIIVTYISENIGLSDKITLFLYMISILGTIMLVTFSVPSTYAYFGIQNNNINNVISILKYNNISTIYELETLENNIEIIYERVLARINTFKWLVGAYWIIFTFMQNQQMSIAKKLENKDFLALVLMNINEIIVSVSITLVAIWLISSYKRASDFLFKGIIFGINEFKYQIDSELPKKSEKEVEMKTAIFPSSKIQLDRILNQ